MINSICLSLVICGQGFNERSLADELRKMNRTAQMVTRQLDRNFDSMSHRERVLATVLLARLRHEKALPVLMKHLLYRSPNKIGNSFESPHPIADQMQFFGSMAIPYLLKHVQKTDQDEKRVRLYVLYNIDGRDRKVTRQRLLSLLERLRTAKKTPERESEVAAIEGLIKILDKWPMRRQERNDRR